MTYHIHINGIVQGVGFRPLICQLANEMELKGYVKNGNNGVHIYFNGTPQVANTFFHKIKSEAPSQSQIIKSMLQEAPGVVFDDFSILVEEDDDKKNVLISPDKSICKQCRHELYDVNSRRYRYPFITCTHCGPRYSIMNKLPFERHNTSMKAFIMCKSCRTEYNDIDQRRFFSQTNSCEACGIGLGVSITTSSMITPGTETALLKINSILANGKIVAVKGIGGYLLMCDANNQEAISRLRTRKHRPAKPFALLYPGIESVLRDFELSRRERKLLEGEEAPIVLLYPKIKAETQLKIKNIAPGLNRLGIMLPSNPLLDIIATDFGKPLIATSANISGSPIIYKDEVALSNLFQIADIIVSHNREIIVPEDDSVVQVSRDTGTEIILRRSRGLAPSFLHYKPITNEVIVAMGALLKSSFTIAVNKNIFISQYLGSTESYESEEVYKDTLAHWLKLYDAEPKTIITDNHPNYFSHQYAVELSKKHDAGLRSVQHHEAHFASVLAENNLIESPEAVLGIIWDGTGLGNDGNIWGGEFFMYEQKIMSRCCHFDYFPVIAGDKLAMEPRIALLCTTNNEWPKLQCIREKFNHAEWKNYQSLIRAATLFSSSVGRIFDAVASILNLCDKQTYEGEAAMYLQALAEEWVRKNKFEMDDSYFTDAESYERISTSSLLHNIIRDVKSGLPESYIAAKFHYSLVSLIGLVAKKMNVKKICFSGGVFQNALLVDWIRVKYSSKFELFFHIHLSPNDENISFGQLAYYDNDMKTSSVRNSEFVVHSS